MWGGGGGQRVGCNCCTLNLKYFQKEIRVSSQEEDLEASEGDNSSRECNIEQCELAA